MLSPLRNRFGIPGVISVIALVFAMLGGAYAASDNGGSGNATASAKGKKGPPGKRGKPGPQGPAGPAGPGGPAGAKGDTGAAGSNGTNGTNGAPGKDGTSVTSEEFGVAGKEGKCVGTGGSKFTAGASKTFACNGKNGEDGETGFTETLPSGKTETGNWSMVGYYAAGPPVAMGTISYPIPLAEPSENVVYLTKAETEGSVGAPVEGCEYDLSDQAATPVAASGTLCIFTREEEFGTFKQVGPGDSGDTPSGASLWVETTELEGLIGAANMHGTWAVTAK